MDISNLIYDSGRIKSSLTQLEDGSVVATKPLKVIFPKRFEENNFALIEEDVTCVGMVGVIVNNKYYAPIATLMRLIFTPGEIEETLIEGERYVVMSFEQSETVIKRLVCAQENMLGYYYYMEFIKFANIPWYLTYEQILAVMDEAKYFTGKSTADTNQTLRILYGLTARDPSNGDIPFRYSSNLENKDVNPKIIGINNPGQLLTDTFSRFSGGYLNENITSALLDDNVIEATEVEKIVKGIVDERD